MQLELKLPEEKILSEAERKSYNGAIFAVFPILEKDIQAKMYEELINTYTISVGTAKSINEVALATARGSGIIEGMAILLEHWRLASLEAQSPKEE